MRCKACDVALNDFEATRKSEKTGEYLDLCNRCLDATGIDSTDERYDLEGVNERWKEQPFGRTDFDDDGK